MTSYKLKLQLGDFIFFQKEFILTQNTYYDLMNNANLNTLQDLLPAKTTIPQLVRGVSIDKGAKIKRINIVYNKLYYIRSKYTNYYINLQRFTSFDDYLSKFSAKTRGTLKRKVKKSIQKGFTHKVYTSTDKVEEFHDYSCLVGNKTYQKKCFNAAIPDTKIFRNILIEQAKKNKFLGAILFFNNKPCAYLYCPIVDETYRYTYLGYLQEYSKYSPGTILQIRLLQYIYSLPLTANLFDFTEGEGAHKKLFATGSHLKVNCLVVENSVANQLLLRTQIMVDSLSNFLGELLHTLKIKHVVKNKIRNT